MNTFAARRSFSRIALIGAAAGLVWGAEARGAGESILVADRGAAKKIWRLTDANNDGVIDNSEVHVWFDGTNLAGTPNAVTLAAFGSRASDDTVIGGDSGLDRYFWYKDLNQDGDANDAGESKVMMTGAAGFNVDAPTGVGFFPNGDFMGCNSGNTSLGTQDNIVRLHDFNSNGSYDDAGDATPWVTVWPGYSGTGNGPYTPFEVIVDGNGVGYLKNSSSGLNGVWRLADTNGNGRADDPGEFTGYFTSANLSGIAVGAAFPIELDLIRQRSMYITNLTSSPTTRYLIRLVDNDLNGDANGAGEATIVYSTTESGFNPNDILSLPNGDVLLSDVSGNRIFRFHDIDGDGLFTGAGERTTFFTAGGGNPVTDTRQLVLLHPPCAADFNGSGGVTVQDIFDFLTAWFAGSPTADFNGGGLSTQDIFDFLNAWFVGCPS